MKATFVKIFNIGSSILKSGKGAAYYVIWLKILQILCIPLDLFFLLLEKLFVKEEPSRDTPVIFIVGIQRTGSTFLSQVMDQAFPFYALGNYASLFPHSSVIAHHIGKKFYHKQKNRRFSNFYGISTGIFSLGDCYEIWDQWLGKDHYSIPKIISEAKKRSMRNHFYHLNRIYKTPILTKNNRNGMALALLDELFPSSFFIVTERKADEVILSTLKATKDFFGDSGYLWGSVPANFDVKSYHNIVEAACHQFVHIEKIIEEDLKKIDTSRYIRVDYHEFCSNPNKVLQACYDKIINFTGTKHMPLSLDYESFEQSKNATKKQDKLKEINQILDHLNHQNA